MHCRGLWSVGKDRKKGLGVVCAGPGTLHVSLAVGMPGLPTHLACATPWHGAPSQACCALQSPVTACCGAAMLCSHSGWPPPERAAHCHTPLRRAALCCASQGALLSIQAGAGGTDAQDWAEMLERMYLRWGERQGYSCRIVDRAQGGPARYCLGVLYHERLATNLLRSVLGRGWDRLLVRGLQLFTLAPGTSHQNLTLPAGEVRPIPLLPPCRRGGGHQIGGD